MDYRLGFKGHMSKNHLAASQDFIEGAEERAAQSKFLPESGRVTLEQHDILRANGYTFEEYSRWTERRAAKEIQDKHLTLDSPQAKLFTLRQFIKEEAQRKRSNKHKRKRKRKK